MKELPSSHEMRSAAPAKTLRLNGRVLAALVFLVLTACGSILASAPGGGFSDRHFLLANEFFGAGAYTAPEVTSNLANKMTNALAFSPPIDTGMIQFVTGQNVGLIGDLAGAMVPAGVSASYIDAQRAAMSTAAAGLGGNRVLWSLMNEWDQSSGSWVPQGRPSYSGITRSSAYTAFKNYYLSQSSPLGTYLAQPAEERPYRFAAVTDFAANAFYAYDLGVDTCFLEKGIDELSDISTGVAFLRGAARQYDRQWGIDISTWRTSNGMATTYNSQNVLLGGWSASYLKRHYYIAYMSGAHVLKTEATSYYRRAGQLNPFGQMAKDFANFALVRHPDVGRPAVAMALLMDHNSGFDPKHWQYNQANTIWYGDIPYSDGDYMVNNFLKLAFPNHWQHGLAPGAPFANAAGNPDPVQFRNYLAGGGDPLPYEPMSTTRWGDNLDIITNAASQSTLANYKVIALLGGVTIGDPLRAALQDWVAAGGVLVLNVNQAAGFDEATLGVSIQNTVKSGNASRWLSDGTPYTEPAFTYTVVAPSTATVLATGANADPLITSNVVGSGQVILTTPAYLQNSGRDQILAVGTRLFDELQSQYALAQVSGAPVEYIVNQTSNGVIVTVLNHSGTDWNGSITTKAAGPISAVKEFTADQDAIYTKSGSTVQVSAIVPAYDVRVYAVLQAVSIVGPAALPDAKVGQAYPATTVMAAAGSGDYTWSATGLPNGLSIDPSTGTIAGVATTSTGSPFNVEVTVNDGISSYYLQYRLTVGLSLCDINQDGVTASDDVQNLVSEALGSTSGTHDLNGDGSVDVIDVQQVTAAALGLGCPPGQLLRGAFLNRSRCRLSLIPICQARQI